mmetsp:Transcript_9781/g.12059  ORF Transcript_9781/g.12059 Transcript_9781/m.12059 type:complete len:519 (-) Transcript_9781:450-2006(-)
MEEDMEMDELFDRHMDHEGGGMHGIMTEDEEELAGEYRQGASPLMDDEDLEMMEELDEDAEYIPSSSLVPGSYLEQAYSGRSYSGFGDDDFQSHRTVTVEDQQYHPTPAFPEIKEKHNPALNIGRLTAVLEEKTPSKSNIAEEFRQYEEQEKKNNTHLLFDQAPQEDKRPPTVTDYKIIRVIGKGSFGKVFLVRQHSTMAIYAMKVLKKENIVKRNQVEHTRTERSILGYVRHPFIVGLHAAFQTRDKLYFILDYCAGGELFCHLQKLGKFGEARAKFYTAELTLALEHVHSLGVVYRDLKPENVLLNENGHIKLTDFGLSKEGVTAHHKGAHSFCGTPEYLAPEILARRGHGRAVDWWSLGALLFEMLTGLPPFYSRDREKLFEGIRRGHLVYPRYLSHQAKLILKALLHREPSRRLGSGPGDAADIKKHIFFANVDFDALLEGTIPAPWQPQVVGSLDTSQFDREFTSLPINSPPNHSGPHSSNTSHQRGGNTNDPNFAGFTYVAPSALESNYNAR